MHLLAYTASGDEPVSVADARLACRLDDDASELDLDLATSITAAREQAEQITGRCYRQQVLRQELTDWPEAGVRIPVWPVSDIAISYRAAATPDTWTPLPGTVFAWGAYFPSTVLTRKTGQQWPTLADADGMPRVRLDLTAGPASPATVPGSVRRYILATVAAWLEVPAAQRVGQAIQPNPLHERLLDAERLWQ
jgi:uncharacterized phiE125 gp8 family phage protein